MIMPMAVVAACLMNSVHAEDACIKWGNEGQIKVSSMRTWFVMVVFLFVTADAVALPNISDVVTGADMGGIEVTATFTDNTSETATWISTQADAGAANGSGWSLSQQGSTLGNFSNNMILGLWVLENTSAPDIASLSINAFVAGIVFDVLGLQNGDTKTYTPGSDVGRGFQSALGSQLDLQVATYSDLISAPDLYGSLMIDLTAASMVLSAGQQFVFLADTDRIPLPAPILMMAAGLLMLGIGRRGMSA